MLLVCIIGTSESLLFKDDNAAVRHTIAYAAKSGTPSGLSLFCWLVILRFMGPWDPNSEGLFSDSLQIVPHSDL